jgi:hypothetical protein
MGGPFRKAEHCKPESVRWCGPQTVTDRLYDRKVLMHVKPTQTNQTIRRYMNYDLYTEKAF